MGEGRSRKDLSFAQGGDEKNTPEPSYNKFRMMELRCEQIIFDVYSNFGARLTARAELTHNLFP